jgi:uncharacterized membrane protein (DUF485 family)
MVARSMVRQGKRTRSDAQSVEDDLRALTRARTGIAFALTASVVVVYFGFILAVAFARPVLATLLAPGLSVGIVAGALVIVASWLLTLVYVRWANTRYDPALRRLQRALARRDPKGGS